MSSSLAWEWKGRDPFRWLFAPVGLEKFLDETWERVPLIVRRRDPNYFDELLTLADVNDFMSRNDIRYPYLRLVKNGRELPLIDYADDFVYGSNIFPGLLDNDKVFSHYASGATLSFQIFQKCMDSLSRFCNSLEARLRFQVQVNIFVTPRASKGFTAHYDDHSFFILQLSGRKHWKIYRNPVELPLQEFRRQQSTPDLGPPTTEVVLEAGDTLYLPKGFYHEAHTTDEPSTHITLGIFPFTWIQVFDRLLNALKQDVEFRRSTAEFLRQNPSLAEVERQFDQLFERARRQEALPLFEELFHQAASKQIADGRNRLRDLDNIQSLTAERPLERRNVFFRLTPTETEIELRFYDKCVAFPIAARVAVEFIASASGFSVADIPGNLDLNSKMVVVRKLIQEGFVTFAG